ncbi:hypothetical protein MtrunA17_Chr4g0012021 [Medicago truncatula]|uniref:Uncharacterized protein n=1 Tax=Medicago truncatula TaxID=3880 RepID=G7JFW4_MEDTR|nr:hypothetical protein MTR_4g026390 [Medicago truncatula]RHN59324.1 hypothetical protein MtrunA17_Chr4g0012021 [Medicago truncatula]
MASISIAIATRSIKHVYDEDEWFGYAASVACIEDYHTEDVDSSYKEGDDDDDGGYDYAPAA